MKYIIEFGDKPSYQDDNTDFYPCKQIPWWSVSTTYIRKLTPLDKGLEEGKARNENGCVGCRYDDGSIEHSPCDYCCNAYSNQWTAKPRSDEIKVGDEVTPKSNNSNWLGVVVGVDDTNAMVMTRDGYTAMYRLEILKKTSKHFSQVAELLEAMKGGDA